MGSSNPSGRSLSGVVVRSFVHCESDHKNCAKRWVKEDVSGGRRVCNRLWFLSDSTHFIPQYSCFTFCASPSYLTAHISTPLDSFQSPTARPSRDSVSILRSLPANNTRRI